MRTAVLLVLVIGLAVGMSGCVVSIGGECGKCGKRAIVEGGEMTATMAEIEAVSSLISEGSKAEGYRALAQRGDLSEPERICLIKAVEENLITDSSKEEILMVLIQNRPKKEE
ncbi:MAG: hypothetical protein ACYTBP_07565 [Planctomycetota bacterium]